ncbi:lipopolysaccharide biosynthesis protein [Marinobacter sp. VGCF2001]|uniref:lipopolysaccharide biosynthesis protein n=1 Tax=Marinobacter sp. VGCF2001 TaxID=3417189 RepID=UPI003CEAAFB2
MAATVVELEKLRLLFKQAGTLLTGNAFAGALGLAAFLATARHLGAESFGALALITTYAVVIDKLLNFQSWQALIKFGASIATDTANAPNLSRLVSFCLMADVASAAVAGVVGLFLAQSVGQFLGWSDAVLAGAGWFCLVVVCNVTGAATGLLRIAGRYRLLAVHLVLANAFRLIGVVVGVTLDVGIAWFLWVYGISMALGYAVIVFGGLSVARKWKLEFVTGSRSEIRQYLSFLFWTNASSALAVPVKHFDVIVVGAVLNEAAAGQFKVIRQVGQLLGQISSPLYQAVYPFLSRDAGEGNSSGSIRLAWRSGLWVALIALPLALLVSVAGIWWVPSVLGESYNALVVPLIVFAVLSALSLGAGTIHPLFLALGFARETAVILIFTTPLYLWLLWSLVGALGLMGVVIAFGVEFFLVVAIKLLLIQRWRRRGAGLG